MQTVEQIAEQLVADWQAEGKMPSMAWDFRGFAAEAARRATAAGAMQMIAGPSSSPKSSFDVAKTEPECGFAEGEWVADFADVERPRIARVKDAYSVSGDLVLDLVLYSKDGTRIGRESPACGGPRGFEPACPAENWAKIEEPDFDYLARGSKYHWGDRIQRIESSPN